MTLPASNAAVVLDDAPLRLDELVRVARGGALTLGRAAEARIAASRAVVDAFVDKPDPRKPSQRASGLRRVDTCHRGRCRQALAPRRFPGPSRPPRCWATRRAAPRYTLRRRELPGRWPRGEWCDAWPKCPRTLVGNIGVFPTSHGGPSASLNAHSPWLDGPPGATNLPRRAGKSILPPTPFTQAE